MTFGWLAACYVWKSLLIDKNFKHIFSKYGLVTPYIYIIFIRTTYNDKGALHKECRFWEKESDKQIINQKCQTYAIYITGFTSLLSNKSTHTPYGREF